MLNISRHHKPWIEYVSYERILPMYLDKYIYVFLRIAFLHYSRASLNGPRVICDLFLFTIRSFFGQSRTTLAPRAFENDLFCFSSLPRSVCCSAMNRIPMEHHGERKKVALQNSFKLVCLLFILATALASI